MLKDSVEKIHELDRSSVEDAIYHLMTLSNSCFVHVTISGSLVQPNVPHVHPQYERLLLVLLQILLELFVCPYLL